MHAEAAREMVARESCIGRGTTIEVVPQEHYSMSRPNKLTVSEARIRLLLNHEAVLYLLFREFE
jgi:hypothetical protein